MERKKRVYNIILNSQDTTSYTGTRWNAQYFANFANIMEAEALKSSYLVRFRIKVRPTLSTTFNPLQSITALHLGFSTCGYNMSNNANTKFAGILTYFGEVNYTNSVTSYYSDTKITDNPPMYIDNLANTNVINLSVFDISSPITFFGSIGHYVCIVTFEEQ